MKKIIAILTLSSLLLFSCSKIQEETKDISKNIEKKDFLIETKKVSDFWNNFEIIKNWKMISKNELSIQSQASWKISKILKKEWDKLQAWETIMIIDDSISNFWINIEKIQNNIDKLNLSYETNNINLQKNIDDLKIALEKAQLNYNTTYKNSKIVLSKSEYDYNSSLNTSNISKEKNTLDIEKLEKDLSKAKLDYETSIKNDENTINSFKENIKTYYYQIDLLSVDLINFLDEVFWVSDINKYKNDSFEIYLWAKNTSLKNQLENEIRFLLSNTSLKNKDLSNLDNTSLEDELSNLEKNITNLKNIVSLAEDVVRNSITSSSFSQNNIDSYISSLNNYSNSLQSNYSQIISLKNNIKSFLDTYLEVRKSKEKQIDILLSSIELSKKSIDIWNISIDNSIENTKTSFDKTKIDLDNQVQNALLTLQQAQANYDNAIKNKELTLKNIKLSIKEAQTSMEEMQKNYQKLIIKSPISWIIQDIKVDLWQDVSIWRELLTFVWDNEKMIEFYVNSEELKNFYIWQKWDISYNDKTISWEIINISSVWNDKFNFKITVKIIDKVDLIWDFAKISFKNNSQKFLLNLNYVKIIWNEKWVINIFENWKIVEKKLDLWKTYNWKIEIITPLKNEDKIIITDIKNFDENKYVLKEIK